MLSKIIKTFRLQTITNGYKYFLTESSFLFDENLQQKIKRKTKHDLI